jgi:tRNA 2-thiouridine synthesizing protein E
MGYADLDKNEQGYLADHNEWSEEIAREIAAEDGIDELTERHWDVIKFLRNEFIDNHGSQPNDRSIVKGMSAFWGEKVGQNDLYDLYPMQPSKQASKIAGLPESRRKGGY